MKCEIQSYDIIKLSQEVLPVACFTSKPFYAFYHELLILPYCILPYPILPYYFTPPHKWCVLPQINNCNGKKYYTMNKLAPISVSDRKRKIVPKKLLAILF